MDFSGKRALVTGAGAGIGRQIALHLSKLGAEVFALSRTKSRLENLQVEDSKIKIITCDLSDWDATRESVKALLPLQLVVNNAAIYRMEKLATVTKENLEEHYAVNAMAPINICQLVANDLVERGMTGGVVNISSDGSLTGYSDALSYNMSKAALDSSTRSAVSEMSPKGIRFNTLNLSLVLTEMGKIWVDENVDRAAEYKRSIPLQRFLDTGEVAAVVAFLLSEQSAMINGMCIPLDGGMKVTNIFKEDL